MTAPMTKGLNIKRFGVAQDIGQSIGNPLRLMARRFHPR